MSILVDRTTKAITQRMTGDTGRCRCAFVDETAYAP